jgi:hypothetical protein
MGDGSVSGPIEPRPSATNAQEALDAMPEGSGFRALRLQVPDPAMPSTAAQISDIQKLKTLRGERDIYSSLWLRTDSDAPFNDLTSYTQLVKYSVLEMPEIPAESTVDIVVLVSPDSLPCQAPALQRRA